MYFRGEGSISFTLLGLEVLKALSKSLWIEVSNGLASSKPWSGEHFGASGKLAAVATASGDALLVLAPEVGRFVRRMHWTIWSTRLGEDDGGGDGEGDGGSGCSLGCSFGNSQVLPSSASSNWPSSSPAPSSDRGRQDEDSDKSLEDICKDARDCWAVTGDSAFGCGERGITARREPRVICTGEMEGMHGVGEGGRLGVVGVGRKGDTAPLQAAASLIGVSGAGSTWSTWGVGGLRGVVVVEDIPSTCAGLTAKRQGAREFTCPLVSKKGGTEIQELSLSLRVMTG